MNITIMVYIKVLLFPKYTIVRVRKPYGVTFGTLIILHFFYKQTLYEIEKIN